MNYGQWYSRTAALAIAGNVMIVIGTTTLLGGLIWRLVSRRRAARRSAATHSFVVARDRQLVSDLDLLDMKG